MSIKQFVLVQVAACAAIAASAASAATLVVTADTQGVITDAGQTGIARRAAAVAALRAKDRDLLLVDAGNFLFGPDSAGAAGNPASAAYAACGYDVVNISYRDLRMGKQATLDAVKDAKFACVSANLLDAATDQPLFKPFVVKQVGPTKIAVVGVTDLSPAVAALPHMRKQLEGVKIVPVAEALAAVLPKAKAQADRVVLLYYGSQAGLTAVREKFGSELLAIAVGGARPEYVPIGGGPAALAVHEQGADLAVLSLTQEKAQSALVKVDASVTPDPQVAKAVEAALPPAAGPAEPRGPAEGPAAQDGASGQPLAALEPDKMNPLNVAGQSKGLKLRVTGLQVATKHGDVQAEPPGRLIVLQTQWINRLDMPFEVPSLADHVYVVVNGSQAARLHPQAGETPNHVSTERIVMPKLASIIKGDLVFQTSATEIRSLELRFYETTQGNVFLPLVQGPAVPQAKPLAGPAGNTLVELAVFGLRRSDVFGGKKAPAGLTYVVLDLRGQSLSAGGAGKTQALADLPEWSKYTYLVAEGEYAYLPSPSPDWPEHQRLLPGILTGGQVAFLAPRKAACLELRMDFPSLERGPRAPAAAAIVLTLEGAKPQPPARTSLAEAVDEMFQVKIVSQSTVSAVAGHKAEDGGKLLLLDVSVSNTGKSGQWFQAGQQVKFLGSGNGAVEMSELSAQCPRPGGEVVWVPAGQRRTFQMVFQVPAEEKLARVQFTDAKSQKTLKLKPIGPAVALGDGEGTQIAATPPAKPAPRGEPDEDEKPQPLPAEPAKPTEPAKPVEPTKPVEPKPIEPVTPPKPADPAKPVEPPTPPDLAQPATAPAGQETLNVPKAGVLPLVKVGDVTVFDPKLTPKGLAGAGLTQEQVDKAVLRGKKYLWDYLLSELEDKKPAVFSKGPQILAMYALVHAGAMTDNPLFLQCLRKTLREIEASSIDRNYQAGLIVMLSDALSDRKSFQGMRAALRHILDSQGEEGSWNYWAEDFSVLVKLMEADQKNETGFGAKPLRRISQWSFGRDGDNSVTQFSVLGLWAATRAGFTVDPDIWRRCLAVTAKRQSENGSMGYESEDGYGSMTCAFICTTAICQRQLGQNPMINKAIHRALAWLIQNWTLKENSKDPNHYHYYYVYCLERVGGCLGIDFIGPHEWYPEGAKYLLSKQRPDGSWKDEDGDEDEVLATSFSMLFLTKATARPAAPPIVPGTLQTAAVTRAPERVYIILDASSSMNADATKDKTKFQVAQEAVETIVRDLPAGTQVALRVYGHKFKDAPGGPSEDTALEIPMGKLNKAAFAAKVRSLYPRGKTPLALSLEMAAKDLAGAGVATDKPVSVVLLTDGWEDTAKNRNPIQAAKAFADLPGATLQVIAFDVEAPAAVKQLQDIANAAGGLFWPITKLDDLAGRMRSTIWAAAGPFDIVDGAGKVVASGKFGQTLSLPPGTYRLRTSWDGRDIEVPVVIRGEDVVKVTLNPSQPARPLTVQGGK